MYRSSAYPIFPLDNFCPVSSYIVTIWGVQYHCVIMFVICIENVIYEVTFSGHRILQVRREFHRSNVLATNLLVSSWNYLPLPSPEKSPPPFPRKIFWGWPWTNSLRQIEATVRAIYAGNQKYSSERTCHLCLWFVLTDEALRRIRIIFYSHKSKFVQRCELSSKHYSSLNMANS